MRIHVLAASILLFAFPLTLAAQPRPAKKMIEYGWDVPYPGFIQKNIRAMEARPFDGLIFRLQKHNHAFDTRPWQVPDLQPELDTLAAIQWGKFTENFPMLYAANDQKMDWFNDAQWETVAANMKLFMRAVAAGRCPGLCFDPEPYGADPWVFKGKYGEKPFAEVAKQVRARGRQFIAALQAGAPRLKVLTFFMLSLFGPRTDEPGEAQRLQRLAEGSYALWPAFITGMIEGAAPGVTFIDGNEPSYYYTDSEGFYRAYHLMRQKALTLVPPELRAKYNAQVQAGMSVYIDQALALRTGRPLPANHLAPADRLKLLEHNAYYALATTDQYVWVYGEKMNWWGTMKNSLEAQAPAIPDGLEAALVAARRKNEAGQRLGLDLIPAIAAAKNKLNVK